MASRAISDDRIALAYGEHRAPHHSNMGKMMLTGSTSSGPRPRGGERKITALTAAPQAITSRASESILRCAGGEFRVRKGGPMAMTPMKTATNQRDHAS